MTYTKTETAGFYKALLTQPSHKTEIRNFAVNVDPAEGDLRALTAPDLAYRFAPLKTTSSTPRRTTRSSTKPRGEPGRFVAVILLIVLIVEQCFAWS